MRLLPAILFLLVCSTAFAQGGGGNPFSQSALNPQLSAIGDFSLANVSRADDAASAFVFPGFLSDAVRDGKERGFNFNFLELDLSASVDPYFDFFSFISIEPDGIDVEELYVNTRQLPWGFALRLGKLFSAFGRLNSQHKHFWDFLDPPLVYEAFIGAEGIKDVGARLSWTAPFDFLLQVHLEVFQGKPEGNPTFDAEGFTLAAENGSLVSAPDAAVPALFATSVKTSFDSGDHVVLLGVSAMTGPTTATALEGPASTGSMYVSDRTWLYGADVTYKWLMGSYRSLALQAEFLRRQSEGTTIDGRSAEKNSVDKVNSGLYVQAVWRFDPNGRWRVGARYDILLENESSHNGGRFAFPADLPRYSGMLEFSPTEFSRLRLQYNYDRSRFAVVDVAALKRFDQKDLQEILLQLTFAVGPHGAHSF
ncbi:MAG: hypothetical protein HZA90_16885 [Verrucomicrobia bacterium]|nr:hypothetical protein [Verrucomicrobiota bacterium]